MHLLHKNYILAGILSIAIAGFIGSSSASALDGFSFSDIINQQQTQREQLLSYLTNPFGASTDCESTNPDSTISCNTAPYPELLFNKNDRSQGLWGHNGRGVIFADSNNLVNGNPQLATAKRGDTLHYSMELETERYSDDEETTPIPAYGIFGLHSKGITVDPNSIILKIGEDVIPIDDDVNFETATFEDDSEQMKMFGGAKSAFYFQIPWGKENDGQTTFLYPEDAIISISYTATVDSDAPSEVFSRGAYTALGPGGTDPSFASTEHQATALLDGGIVIRRVDNNGNPLAGAKYTVDGVKATATAKADNVFAYEENGTISTFETGMDGYIVITNVPFGTYTVREVQAPQGHETQVEVLTRSNTDNLIDASYGEETFMLSLPGEYMNADVTECIENLQNGKRGLDDLCAMSKFGTSPATLETVATWNEEEQAYTNDDGLRITKEGDSFKMNEFIIPYDSETGKYSTTVTVGDMFEQLFGGDLIFTVNNDDTATFAFNDQIRQFRLNKSTGCYDPVDEEETIGSSFCKDGNNYIAKTYDDRDYYIIAIPTDQPGEYKVDYDYMYLTIDVLDNNTVKLGYYFAVFYSEYLDKYLVSLQSTYIGAVPLENSQSHVMAAEYLFQDKTMGSPENISNPQTSDAVLKAIFIATIGLAPIFIFRKQISKRAN